MLLSPSRSVFFDGRACDELLLSPERRKLHSHLLSPSKSFLQMQSLSPRGPPHFKSCTQAGASNISAKNYPTSYGKVFILQGFKLPAESFLSERILFPNVWGVPCLFLHGQQGKFQLWWPLLTLSPLLFRVWIAARNHASNHSLSAVSAVKWERRASGEPFGHFPSPSYSFLVGSF